MHKGQVRGRHTIEILAFAGIRERIQNSHVDLRMVAHHPVHEVRADEPCATGYQNVLRHKRWSVGWVVGCFVC